LLLAAELAAALLLVAPAVVAAVALAGLEQELL
jgi:hypothetical protein